MKSTVNATVNFSVNSTAGPGMPKTLSGLDKKALIKLERALHKVLSQLMDASEGDKKLPGDTGPTDQAVVFDLSIVNADGTPFHTIHLTWQVSAAQAAWMQGLLDGALKEGGKK
jgi:hypothetical protein